MKIWYFENTHRGESKAILYDIIYPCILVEKYDQSKLEQNFIFSTKSSITGQREYNSFMDSANLKFDGIMNNVWLRFVPFKN